MTTNLANRDILISLFPKNTIGMELGVDEGGFSKTIEKTVNPSKLYLVDAWINQDCKIYNDPINTSTDRQLAKYQKVKEYFSKNPNIEVIRGYSSEVVKTIPDNFLDWIYIDSNHSYESVKEDLKIWCPKVKVGGFITGHDYIKPEDAGYPVGVIKALHEFISEKGYNLDYLTTETHKFCSWGFIKTK
jgi:hypothetical protein